MILPAFIIILMAGGIIAWIAERWNPILSRWISLLALLFNLVDRSAPLDRTSLPY